MHAPFADVARRVPGRRIARVCASFCVALTVVAAACGHVSSSAEAAEPQRAERGKVARKQSRTADTFGHEGDPKKVTRTISIETSDTMRYFPDHVSVKKGQTVRFNVRNAGEIAHEMVLGTMDDLKKYAALAKQRTEPLAEEPNVARVEPGKAGRIVWQFTRAGEFYYGCFMPGHFEAGMIGTIVVR